MDVTIRTEKTYALSMTESQARDLLNLACMDDLNVGTRRETLDDIRQALLTAGLQKDPT